MRTTPGEKAVAALDDYALERGFVSTADMSREDWLNARRKYGVGASESPILLGFNQWKTPVGLYYDKIGDEGRITDTDSLKMRAGRDIEEIIAQWFSEDTGLNIQKDHKIRLHEKYPGIMACNLDRFGLTFDERGPFVHEIKMMGLNYWKRLQEDMNADADDPLPVTYNYLQVQHQLAVTGLNFGFISYYVVGDYDQELYHIEITRDEEWISKIEQACIQFWTENVMKRIPPTPQNRKDVELVYPEHLEGEAAEATEAVRDWLASRNELNSQIKELSGRKSELEDKIAAFAGASERIEHDGRILATYKTQKRRSYTVPEKSYRVLRVKNNL